jgi:hypothetical protein
LALHINHSIGKTVSTSRRLKLDPYLSSCTKIHSKWIKDLNVRPQNFGTTREKLLKTQAQIKLFWIGLQLLRK